MPKSAKNTKKASDLLFKNRQLLNVIVIILSLVFVYDLVIGGNMRFYAKWVECGSKPIEGRGPGFSTTDPKSYKEGSAMIQPYRLYPDLFCTPLEAEKAGYSANPNSYDFPNLRAERENET